MEINLSFFSNSAQPPAHRACGHLKRCKPRPLWLAALATEQKSLLWFLKRLSPRNTSESQTDNCDRPKTISLSQPISSLSPEQGRQTGRPQPRTEEYISAGLSQMGASPTRNFGCTRTSGRGV